MPRTLAHTLAGFDRLHEVGARSSTAPRSSRRSRPRSPAVVYGNVPNDGLIDGLPDGCCVEVPCLVDAHGVQPVRVGPCPPADRPHAHQRQRPGAGGRRRAAGQARARPPRRHARPAHGLFGALLVWDTWRFIQYDRIWRYYVAPEFTFTYPGFGWVQPLPEPWIHLAWLMVGVLAFLVMIGLFYRLAIVGLTVLLPTSSCSTKLSISTTSTW
jgi:hypothetical protein